MSQTSFFSAPYLSAVLALITTTTTTIYIQIAILITWKFELWNMQAWVQIQTLLFQSWMGGENGWNLQDFVFSHLKMGDMVVLSS